MATKVASRLDKVKRGPSDNATKFLIYGPEGVGKSTLASFAPNPIFFDLEDGTSELDVARYTFRDGATGHIAATYDEVTDAIKDLLTSPHDYKTLVIDTADRLESLIWAWMLRRDSGKVSPVNKNGAPYVGLEAYGYNKGYNLALDEWRKCAELLDVLRLERKMHLVTLGHAAVMNFKNPTGEDYDRFQPAIHKLAGGFLKGWHDVVGFLSFEDVAGRASDDDKRARGFSTGRRLLRFTHSAAFDAKCRIALPPEIELDIGNPWAPFATALEAAHKLPPAKIVTLIELELDRLADDELSAKVRQAVKQASKDRGALARYLNNLRGRQPQPQEKEQQDA